MSDSSSQLNPSVELSPSSHAGSASHVQYDDDDNKEKDEKNDDSDQEKGGYEDVGEGDDDDIQIDAEHRDLDHDDEEPDSGGKYGQQGMDSYDTIIQQVYSSSRRYRVRSALQPAPQIHGYFKRRLPYMAADKENWVEDPRRKASTSSAISHQQFSGPIRPHSGPFSGPLAPHGKHTAPKKHSIIPANLPRTKGAAMVPYPREPLSPKVNCLGLIRNADFDIQFAIDVTEDNVEFRVASERRRIRDRCCNNCFDTCNKKCRNGKIGQMEDSRARDLSSRRFESSGAGNSNHNLQAEHSQTRRERAAVLAQSLSDLIESMRRSDAQDSHQYIPSCPPPNSLLLMRGCTRNQVMDMACGSIDTEAEVASEADHNLLSGTSQLMAMRSFKSRRKAMDAELSHDYRMDDSSPEAEIASDDELNMPSRSSLLIRMRSCRSMREAMDVELGKNYMTDEIWGHESLYPSLLPTGPCKTKDKIIDTEICSDDGNDLCAGSSDEETIPSQNLLLLSRQSTYRGRSASTEPETSQQSHLCVSMARSDSNPIHGPANASEYAPRTLRSVSGHVSLFELILREENLTDAIFPT
ncbi:hypothetical protein KP509_21G079800 [Ceratopteris richardii]|nr:hypothetical protein KP509_21G079800 [Ceratopteris richardii]